MTVLKLPKALSRPLPPDLGPDSFAPSTELADWLKAVFIYDAGPLANETYHHLDQAEIACLWTSMPNSRGGRSVVGQCELMPPMAMGKWQRGRAIFQIEQWFGDVPDFLLTFDAGYCASVDDASFCALVEHELHHCGQDVDVYGAPKFTQEGGPKFAIRGHDVEEFVGVVERYGADKTGTQALVEAAKRGPTIAAARIGNVCGTCQRRAA